MSKRNLRRIRPGCSCADILRNTRNTRKMSANIKYQHVDGHMDKYLSVFSPTDTRAKDEYKV